MLRQFRQSLLLVSALVPSFSMSAYAGGFEVHEQSALFQGMSFAGAAAGGSLSSMFWNPAAATAAQKGFNFDSNFSLILPQSHIHATSLSNNLHLVRDTDVEIGKEALVPASYAAWRGDIDPKLVFAVGLNSQFGLGTKPDNNNWAGQFHARSADLFSINATPTVSYDVTPGITIGVGAQVQYIELKRFKSAAGPAVDSASANLTGHDIALGFTAGVLLKPIPGTTLGLGYRSAIQHELTGSLSNPNLPAALPVTAKLQTPDKATFSFSQALAANMRATGTVEWTNWSKLGVIPVVTSTGAAPVLLDFQWHDGWMFALGGEYDVNSALTVRAGGAYEISPIQNPSERLIQLPDADRIWASVGASYKWSEATTFDFAYSHVFVEDADISRRPSANGSTLLFTGTAESSVDIVSVGMRSRW